MLRLRGADSLAFTTLKLQKQQPATAAIAQGLSVQLLVQPSPHPHPHQLIRGFACSGLFDPWRKSSRRVRECGNAEKILKGARGKGRSRETVRAKRKAEQREVKLVRGHRKGERNLSAGWQKLHQCFGGRGAGKYFYLRLTYPLQKMF